MPVWTPTEHPYPLSHSSFAGLRPHIVLEPAEDGGPAPAVFLTRDYAGELHLAVKVDSDGDAHAFLVTPIGPPGVRDLTAGRLTLESILFPAGTMYATVMVTTPAGPDPWQVTGGWALLRMDLPDRFRPLIARTLTGMPF